MADAVYLLDPESSSILWCNRSAYEMLGLNEEEVLNHSVLSLQKDVQGLPQWGEIRQVIEAGSAYTFVGRHRHKSGGEVGVEVVTTHFESDGKRYFLSVARDITRRLALEKELQTREHSLWFGLNEAADGIWEWEITSSKVYFSPQLKKMLGYGPDEMEPHLDTWADNVHPDDKVRVMEILSEHLRGIRSDYQAEYRLRNRNGHYIWVSDRGKVCQRTETGEASHVVGMVQNITEYKQLQEQLEELASNDVLTQLPNRREGEKQARQHLALAKRLEKSFSVAVVDFDHFKKINDLYGHQKGDEILVFGSELMRKSIRVSDYIYRWGGEEFVVIFPATDGQQALNAVEHIHTVFRQADWEEFGIEPITLSVGIACYPENGASFDLILKEADRAVYQAKAAGRNRSILARN